MLVEQITREAATLSDEALISAFRCAERCALLTTRTRRELALQRARCFSCELERRARLRAAALERSPHS